MRVLPGWLGDADLLPAVRSLFEFGDEDRATGYLSEDWGLLDRLESDLGVRFTIVAFQAYRDWNDGRAFVAWLVCGGWGCLRKVAA